MAPVADCNSLTPKQLRFCEEYLIDSNATQAAIRAGYSRKSAHSNGPRLVGNAAVARKIAELTEARSQRTQIDADWVLRRLVELHDRCVQEIRPAVDRRGKQLTDPETGVPLFTFNAAAAVRSLELIGKHVAVSAFAERIEVGAGDELIARLNEGRARMNRQNAEAKARRLEIEGEAIDVTPKAPLERGPTPLVPGGTIVHVADASRR